VPFTQAAVVGYKSFSKTHLTLVECPNSITTRVDLKTEPTLQIIKWLVTATTLVVALALFSVATAQQTSPSIENAKKEGEVIWYGTLTGGSIVGRIIGAFESKYPFIKVKYLRLGGAGLIERIRSEARSGKYLWDTVTAEYIQFFELPKYVALAKYTPPDFAQYSPKHRDPNGTWVSFYGAIATIAWNTRLVKPVEAPKDWKDLLDPRWKGKKIGLPAEAFQWYGGMVAYLGDKPGREYMRALAEQDPQMQAGYTNTANLLVAGEFPVAVIRAHRIEDATSKGAPVDWSAEANPIVISIHPIGISEKALHPNAARLFEDFLTSVEGQSLFTEEGFLSSHSGVKPRFPRMNLDRIKYPAPPDTKVSERIQTWLTEYQQTFRIPVGRK
jgi:iron(III) transport system substrate-binding protein